MHEFWRSSGYHLLAPREGTGLVVTPDFLHAILSRPELQPMEESCDAEIALFEDLQADPEREVPPERLAALADPDARENWEVALGFRDLLRRHGTLEAAYMAIIGRNGPQVPPLFLSQLVHVLLRHILKDCRDPIRLRAAEVFYRTQTVNTDEGRIMLADEEIVEMYAANNGLGGLGQLLASTDTAARAVELDVLDEDNKRIYWERSDRFDMVVDFRFTQPALDAFARVIEAWIAHFLGLRVRIQPMQRIDDERWSWHIGLDAEATRILNALYAGKSAGLEDLQQIIALFRMDVRDRDAIRPDLRGRAIYLGLARTRDGLLRMKPQNLLVNMPLVQSSGAAS